MFPSLVFIMVACSAAPDHAPLTDWCLHDPAVYRQPRTVEGCHAAMRAMIAEADHFETWERPKPEYRCITIRGD